MKNRFAALIKRPIKRDQRGDTIVEVMIVLAVLSLAFAISYATANRGLNQSRNAQEHSQALGVSNSQIELVRTAVAQHVPGLADPSRSFCMTTSDVTSAGAAATVNNPNNLVVGSSGYPAACVQNGLYYQSVRYEAAHNDFVFTTRWNGVGSLGAQQERLAYRIPELQTNPYTGITLVSSPAKLRVTAMKIPPAAGNVTPSCSNAATQIKDTTVVTINEFGNGTDIQSKNTTDSVALFSGTLHEYSEYKATIVPPAGYGACNPNPSGANRVTPGTTAEIEMKIYPICNTTDTTVYDPDTYSPGSYLGVRDYGLFTPSHFKEAPPGFYGYEFLNFTLYYFELDHVVTNPYVWDTYYYRVYNANIQHHSHTVSTPVCPP